VNKVINQKTVFHGDTIPGFESLKLQGFITCYSCGEKKGPIPIKGRNFGYDEECQLAEDNGLVLGMFDDSDGKGNEEYKFMCIPCVCARNIPFIDPVFKPSAKNVQK